MAQGTVYKSQTFSCSVPQTDIEKEEEKIILQQVIILDICINFTMKMLAVSVLVVAMMALTHGADSCDFLKEFGAMKEKQRVMETRLTDSETKLKESENQILELKKKERTVVVFSAATDQRGTIGPFRTDTTLVYKVVKSNIGNAYSQSTGTFIAPVPGIYYFTLFYHAGGSRPAYLTLMKNNEVVVTTSDHATSHDGADNGGNAVFLQLKQGDCVYVRLRANTHVWGSNFGTTFSGFLVSQV
ncbi:caprin-2 isoform X2 [Dicentrarchus labrax]|uniref:C1q domain-containing protein n=1 Tax=Dicentrarchus labrax TaxID=13489 RepID=A0A8C4GIZ1_DICLA|nr:caprin-2 isoform X2 [Dicentrarchus labrax]